jgi:hypothetical protein
VGEEALEGMTESQPVARPSRWRRLGCAAGVVFWFVLLLLPCVIVLLVSQREVVIPLGSIPGQSARIWLIDEARERGIAFSMPSVHRGTDDLTCVQTDSRFLMWMGQGDPTSYCECFRRIDENWQSQRSAVGACVGE